MRRWLKANKIIFDTLAAALLSLMAIIVSVGQALVSYQQTNLQRLQTTIAEAQALPQFTSSISQEFDPASGKFIHDHLVVSNHGGFVYEFEARTAEYLIVTLSEGAQPTSAELPLNGYFSAAIISAEGTGNLVTFRGFHNTEKQVEIERGVRDVVNRSKGFANVDLRLVLRLTYTDLLGRPHRDYFDVKPVTGSVRLAGAAGDVLFDRWVKSDRLEFSKLSAEQVVQLARANAKPIS